jgi:hypothetical protein
MEASIRGVFSNEEHMGIAISWSGDQGFGEIVLKQKPNGKMFIDSEYMGMEFVQKVLSSLANNAILED